MAGLRYSYICELEDGKSIVIFGETDIEWILTEKLKYVIEAPTDEETLEKIKSIYDVDLKKEYLKDQEYRYFAWVVTFKPEPVPVMEGVY